MLEYIKNCMRKHYCPHSNCESCMKVFKAISKIHPKAYNFIKSESGSCFPDGGNGNPDPPPVIDDESKIVEIKNEESIITMEEHICDMEIWEGKLYIGAYFGYKPLKLYTHVLGGNGIQVDYTVNNDYESIYRLWANPSGEAFSFSTEQPPEWFQRTKTTGWQKIEHYADKGWALLGDTLNNGKEFRGHSYNNRNTAIKWYDNVWKDFQPQLVGKDGKSRIVWAMEYFNGHYYACCSPTDAYAGTGIGNIYRLDSNTWTAIKGYDAQTAGIGGVVTCCVGDDHIFFGTYQPQQILWLDKNGVWGSLNIYDKFEVNKIWKDKANHIFAGATTHDQIMIYQWNLKTKAFEIIYTKQINSPEGRQWNTFGICSDNETMYVKYRNGDRSYIIKLGYKQKEGDITPEPTPEPDPEPEPTPEPDPTPNPTPNLPFNLSDVTWLRGPNISSWPEAANLKSVSVGGQHVTLDYDKASVWPDGGGDLNANAWVFIHHTDGKWYGATFEWMRPGQTVKLKAAICGKHIMAGPFKDGWLPTVGKEYGFMVSGMCRDNRRNVEERSNIVMAVYK